jgi:hypothetical protein
MTKFFICGDPGEKKDSFSLGMAHAEQIEMEITMPDGNKRIAHRYKTVMDFLIRWEPDKDKKLTVLFENVEDIVVQLNGLFLLQLVTYDQWQSTSSLQSFFKNGIPNQVLPINAGMYLNFKGRAHDGLIEYPQNEEFIGAINDEMKKVMDVRGKINKPEGGHKDRADVIVRLDYLVTQMELNELANDVVAMPKREDYTSNDKYVRSVYKAIERREKSEQGIWGGSGRGSVQIQNKQGSIWGTSSNPNGNLVNSFGKKR